MKNFNLFSKQHVSNTNVVQQIELHDNNNSAKHKTLKTIGVGFIIAFSALLVVVVVGLVIDAPKFLAALFAIAFIFSKIAETMKICET